MLWKCNIRYCLPLMLHFFFPIESIFPSICYLTSLGASEDLALLGRLLTSEIWWPTHSSYFMGKHYKYMKNLALTLLFKGVCNDRSKVGWRSLDWALEIGCACHCNIMCTCSTKWGEAYAHYEVTSTPLDCETHKVHWGGLSFPLKLQPIKAWKKL